MTPKKILVPLDGSTLAECALAPAADLAARHRAAVILLRAAYAPVLPAADPTEAQVTAGREAETYLADVAERLRKTGVPTVDTSVWYAPAAEAIAEAAHVRGVDLIVMSTHGRTGLGRLVLGSVAESVLRATRTPILLVREPEAGASVDTDAGARHETARV
jgi:nucleotide-binding universal stress UspA family protein